MSNSDGTLEQKVQLLLEVPFEKLMRDTRLVDMFKQVFTINGKPAKICRSCQSDRNFAYRKLKKFLHDGITEL